MTWFVTLRALEAGPMTRWEPVIIPPSFWRTFKPGPKASSTTSSGEWTEDVEGAADGADDVPPTGAAATLSAATYGRMEIIDVLGFGMTGKVYHAR